MAASPKTPPPSTEVAAPQKTAVAIPPPFDWAAHAGEGTENLTQADITTPRLVIIQSMSPQLQRNKQEYIEAARPGDILDKSLNQILPRPLLVVPVFYQLVWIEWTPRASNKGLAAVYLKESEALRGTTKNDKNQNIKENGNTVQESANFYVCMPQHHWRRAVISMVSTQRKTAKTWMTKVQNERAQNEKTGLWYNPPIYARQWSLNTANQSNAQGSWEGWTIEADKAMRDLPEADVMAPQCYEWREQLVAGATMSMKELNSLAGDNLSGEEIPF